MPRKIYETTSEKRKDFWLGFIGWWVLNILMGVIGFVISLAVTPMMSNMDFETSANLMNTVSLLASCLPLLINVGLMILFAFTRSQVALGMLTAFGVALLITICLGVIATVACFVMLGNYQ